MRLWTCAVEEHAKLVNDEEDCLWILQMMLCLEPDERSSAQMCLDAGVSVGMFAAESSNFTYVHEHSVKPATRAAESDEE
jgi:hypothetical protein